MEKSIIVFFFYISNYKNLHFMFLRYLSSMDGIMMFYIHVHIYNICSSFLNFENIVLQYNILK